MLSRPLLETLERMGYGGLLLNTTGHVLALNRAARLFFEDEFDLREQDIVSRREGREAVKKLVARGNVRFRLDTDTWMVVARDGRKPLILHAVALSEPNPEDVHTVLVVIDLKRTRQPSAIALQRIFGLTAAEARLAQLIARGDTPAEIAETHGLSLATVRSQLASVYAKTQTRRQAELVALVTQLSILP